jgi:Icc-related predicted phosphoesterase
MIVTAISDLHGYLPELPGGDLLIVGGDLTKSDFEIQYYQLDDWLKKQDYERIVIIAGNHDNWINKRSAKKFFKKHVYLQNSGCEFRGVKIWGSPNTLAFKKQNPRCAAYSVANEEILAKKFAKIPPDTDILVTHTPPWGILDSDGHMNRYGSEALRARIDEIKPSIHVFGHIHEASGTLVHDGRLFINAAHVDQFYRPKNAPYTINIAVNETERASAQNTETHQSPLGP